MKPWEKYSESTVAVPGKKPWEKYAGSEKPGLIESGLRGAGQGATLGYSDEVIGAGRAGLQKLIDAVVGNEQGDSFGDNYRAYRDEIRANDEAAKAANPKTFTAGEIVGGAAPMIAAGPEITAAKMAALGGIQGLGSSKADLTKGDVGGAAVDAGVGAGTGLVVGKVAPPLITGAGKVLGAAGGALKKGAGWVAKKTISKVLGPSEEAVGALLENPGIANASLEGVTEKLPTVANKFEQIISGLNEKAKSVLSKSRYIEPTESDPGGAFTKDEILGAVQSARRKLGGVYTDEARAAASTLGRVEENLGKVRNTVSQNQVHDLMMDLDNEIPWDKAVRAPQDLTATDHALMDARTSLDRLLKGKNEEYKNLMEPLSEAIQGRNEFAKNFNLNRVKGEGWQPGDPAFNKLRSSLNEGKLNTQRILEKTKNLTGEDLSGDVQNALYGEEFAGGGDKSHKFAGLGTAVGGFVGGWHGAGAGGIAGAAADKVIETHGGKMASNLITTYLKTNPARLGRYAGILGEAAAKGGAAGAQDVIVKHFVLSNTDPEYRNMIESLQKNTSTPKLEPDEDFEAINGKRLVR